MQLLIFIKLRLTGSNLIGTQSQKVERLVEVGEAIKL
jgi:hypothetical protein